MDLAIGAKETWVMMSLFTRDGTSKIVRELTYPVTGLACVTRVYTPDAVFLVEDDGIRVRETFGTSVARLAERIGLELRGGG